MKLEARGLHFLGGNEEERQHDCCLHGGVLLQIGDEIWSDGEDREWCVSAAALRLLRSLFDHHFGGAEEHMIPCCGNMMIPSEDGQTVTVIGCPNGIDFDVIHENGDILLRRERRECRIGREVYCAAVLAFAEAVWDALRSAPPRVFTDDFERDGYRAYLTEFEHLLMCAKEGTEPHAAQEVSFSAPVILTEKDIQGVGEVGISAGGTRYIHFRECAYLYRKSRGGDGRCVGEFDASGTNPSFVFYTAPQVTELVFYPMERAAERTQSVEKRAAAFRQKIEQYGYTLMDVSAKEFTPRNAQELYEMLVQTPGLCGTFTLKGEFGIDWAFSKDISITIGIGPVDGYLSVDRKLFGKLTDPITHWHPEKDALYGEICRIGRRGNVLVIRKCLTFEHVLYMGPESMCPYSPKQKKRWGRIYYLRGE